jgi:hypothetical protein
MIDNNEMKCGKDTAHCYECGSDEIVFGPRCEDCGSYDLVNPDECDGEHG